MIFFLSYLNEHFLFYIFCFFCLTIYNDFQLSFEFFFHIKFSFSSVSLSRVSHFVPLIFACIALRFLFFFFFSLFWTSFFTEDEALSVAFVLFVSVCVCVELFLFTNTLDFCLFTLTFVLIICLDYFAFCFSDLHVSLFC